MAIRRSVCACLIIILGLALLLCAAGLDNQDNDNDETEVARSLLSRKWRPGRKHRHPPPPKKKKTKRPPRPPPSLLPSSAAGRDKSYLSWKRQFGLGYDATEDAVRYQLWLNSDAQIKKAQGKTKLAEFRHNRFSAATDDEKNGLLGVTTTDIIASFPVKEPADKFPNKGTNDEKSAPLGSPPGYTPKKSLEEPMPSPARRRVLANADSTDWSGYFPPPVDQGSCGSSYVFAAVAQIEASLSMAFNETPVALSQEMVLECATAGNAGHGCDGGVPFTVMSYMFSQLGGIWPASVYPYTSSQGPSELPACPAPLRNNRTLRSGEYPYGTGYWSTQLTQYNSGEDNLLALLQTGPVIVFIAVEDDFISYSGGIYDINCSPYPTGLNVTNHAVVAVGFGVDPVTGASFWKVHAYV